MVRDSNPGEGKRHSLLRTRPDRHYSPPSLLYNAYRGSWSGTKRPELAVHGPPLSSAKIEWGYTSTLRACMAFFGETCTSHQVQLRPGKAVRFAADQLLGPPCFLVTTGDSVSILKKPENKAEHSRSSNANVKNA